jgi:hypothetical protein
LRDFGFGKKAMNQYIHDEVEILLEAIDQMIKKDPEQEQTGMDALSILPAVVINTLWYIIAGVKYDLNNKRFIELTKMVLEFFRSGNNFSVVPFHKILQEIPYINDSFKKQEAIGQKLNLFVKVSLSLRSFQFGPHCELTGDFKRALAKF